MIELTYIYSWKGHEYAIQISGTSLSDVETQANALLAAFEARAGKDLNLSSSEGGSITYELDDLQADEDL